MHSAWLCTALGHANGNRHDSEQDWQDYTLCTSYLYIQILVPISPQLQKASSGLTPLKRHCRLGQGNAAADMLCQFGGWSHL